MLRIHRLIVTGVYDLHPNFMSERTFLDTQIHGTDSGELSEKYYIVYSKRLTLI